MGNALALDRNVTRACGQKRRAIEQHRVNCCKSNLIGFENFLPKAVTGGGILV